MSGGSGFRAAFLFYNTPGIPAIAQKNNHLLINPLARVIR
jgi:hypothetical protein